MENHLYQSRNLAKFFSPKSIAIVGASSDFTKLSGKTFKFLLKYGYKGKIYPITPKYKQIADLDCYPKITDVPGQIDLALIMLSAQDVKAVLEECTIKGVKFAVVASSGFGETGAEGKQKEWELKEIAKKSGISILGPNCQGIINLIDQIPLSWTSGLERDRLIKGNIGFVTQSGAYGGAIFNMAQEMGLGFSYWVNTGNEVDLNCLDIMDFLLDDVNTAIIASYVEGFRNPGKLVALAQRGISKEKPLIIMKVGRSEQGQKAALSHTGALTGSDKAFEGLCYQYGIVRVYDLEELFDTMLIFSRSKRPKGNRVGIITSSGGAGISVVDKCNDLGLRVPELNPVARKRLSQFIPPFGSTLNPIDITAQVTNRLLADGPERETLKKCLKILIDDQEIDILIILMAMVDGQRAERAAADIINISNETEKPIVVIWLAGALAEGAYKILEKGGIPLFKSPERAVKAIKRMLTYQEFLKREKGTKE